MVEVCRAVIYVKAKHREGEGVQQLFQGRDEVMLADFLDRTDHFERGDLIDGVDVIHPFFTVQIALLHGIDAEIARLSVLPEIPS